MPDSSLAASTTLAPVHTPDIRHRLSTRIIFLSLIALLAVLGMIGSTLWLSWQLEGAAAAINDAGSLRMRANRVAIELNLAQSGAPHRLEAQIAEQDQTLTRLREGNPARPLFLPDEPAIRAQFDRVADDWDRRVKPIALDASPTHVQAYIQALPGFVEEAHRLVGMVEQDNAARIQLLRLSQGALAVIACMGTVAVIYLLYLWIILPVQRLQDGLHRMGAREFSLRLPVESRDEFGTLNTGFNAMASELQELYQDLAARVAQKTAELALQNRTLETLYDMAAFLNLPNDGESLCREFLERVMRQFDAEGGSIRMTEGSSNGQRKVRLLMSAGLSEDLAQAEACMKADACYCGQPTHEATVMIADLHAADGRPGDSYRCAREGFVGLAIFRIESQRGVLGTFSLHFRKPRQLPASDRQLLETLGQHLGVALDHLHLSATERQLAVVEERNLVAQGLHDSIAQGLNFLNLQVQLLEAAVEHQDQAEIQEIVPLLRCGVEESYQDVRELLVNFRSKLSQGELHKAVEDTVERFRRQCRTQLQLVIEDRKNGPPLQPQQQLQVLFVLQEALSNVRKHAQAENVQVTVGYGHDFKLVVQDDGEGFDPQALAQSGESHVGLRIMRERAARLAADLSIDARPGGGVRVELRLPFSERTAIA